MSRSRGFARSVLRAVSRRCRMACAGATSCVTVAGRSANATWTAGTLFHRDDHAGKLLRPDVFEMVAPYQPWRDKVAVSRIRRSATGSRTCNGCDVKNYLPLDILTKVDRMSMAHSIETRVPLLDHKLMEFAATIPPELNLKNGTTKYIFKQAMRGILPDAIIDRPKRGFAIPLSYWFRGKLGTYVRELLLGESAGRRGFFQASYIENLVAQNDRGRNLDLQLWTLISFELWARAFLDRGTRGKTCQAA